MIHLRKLLLALAASLLPLVSVHAQQPEEPDLYEIIEKETERLQSLLGLEDWQVFYVDSTLTHDFPLMQEEMQQLQKARVTGSSLYIAVQDKWMEGIDRSYEKIFTPVQWEKYLKSGAARAQKQRDKRKGIVEKKEKKAKPSEKKK